MSEISLYIHWPFCDAKCPYCDFNAHVKTSINQKKWLKSLQKEILYYSLQTKGRVITSIFFGGGTPSLIQPNIICEILTTIHQYWITKPNIEITLEANPTSIETQRLFEFKSIGINRVSIGIQSLNKSALKFLGRNHTDKEARKAINEARKVFSNYSFDFIYTRPQQSIIAWQRELRDILKIVGGHLSLYQLNIEPGTPYSKQGIQMPSNEVSAEFYEKTNQIMELAGLPSYEISNYASPGFECLHNLNYWRGGDYIGIGPGAHGRITQNGNVFSTYQIYEPNTWQKSIDKRGHGTAKRKIMSQQNRAEELIMLGLRATEGLNKKNFQKQVKRPFNSFINTKNFYNMVENNFLIETSSSIKATLSGRMCLNLVLEKLLT